MCYILCILQHFVKGDRFFPVTVYTVLTCIEANIVNGIYIYTDIVIMYFRFYSATVSVYVLIVHSANASDSND